jgi:hypothetical protein
MGGLGRKAGIVRQAVPRVYKQHYEEHAKAHAVHSATHWQLALQ